MNQLDVQKPPRWWSPRLSPACVRLCRPIRRRIQRRHQRLLEVEVRGLEQLRAALEAGSGVLITPNHSGHADSFALGEAADRLGRPFYFMVAWQVLGLTNIARRTLLRMHGCFSVDREGMDRTAFKQAVEILQSRPNPLVIFPEGEVYHLNERITPFREGAAAMALSAAKKADRPVVCVPCAVRYSYLEDPTPGLCRVMDRLERDLFWRPRPDLTLAERIHRVAEGALALKELEYLGRTSSGPLPERVRRLSETILARLEDRDSLDAGDTTVPERVKRLRQQAIARLEQLPADDPARERHQLDLDDLYLVVQLFSYPGDYVAERPSIERIAETIDKFEEDLLGVPYAGIRGTRRAIVSFGEPVPAEAARQRDAAARLTRTLEARVQSMLDELSAPPAPPSPRPAAIAAK